MATFRFTRTGADTNMARRHLRISADSEFVKCCKWVTKDGLNRDTTGDGSVVLEGHVLEALACFGSHGSADFVNGMLANRADNRRFKWRQTKAHLLQYFAFVTGLGVFRRRCDTFNELVSRLFGVHGENFRAAELFCGAANWELTADHGSVAPAEAADFDLHLAMHVPLIFKGGDSSLILTGDVIAGMGSVSSALVFRNPNSDFILYSRIIAGAIYERRKELDTAALIVSMFAQELRRITPPPLFRIFGLSPSSMVDTTQDRLEWANSSLAQREHWYAEQLRGILHRLPMLHMAVKSKLTSIVDLYGSFKILGSQLLPNSSSLQPPELLDALNTQYSKSGTYIKQCSKEAKTPSDLFARLGADAEAAKRLKGPSTTTTGDEKYDGTEGSKGFLGGKVILDSSALQAVRDSGSFVTARAKLQNLLDLPDSSEKVHKIFRGISQNGLLVFWQVIYGSSGLKRVEPIVNDVTSFLSPRLVEYVSFALTCGSNGKVQGPAKSFLLDSTLLDFFLKGTVDGKHYTKGCLAVQAAKGGLTGVDSSIAEDEWIYDGEHCDYMRDYWHRLTLAMGYAATPAIGVSAATFFDRLITYRGLVMRSAESERTTLNSKLYSFYRDGLAEALSFLTRQLQDTRPAGKRLEGFLPPESTTSGVLHKIRQQLRASNKMLTLASELPQFFNRGASVMLGGASGHKRERAPDDIDGGGAKDKDPKKAKVIKVGSSGKKVKMLEKGYFQVGSSIMGDTHEFAKEYGLTHDEICMPVALSRKVGDARATMCNCKDQKGHNTLNTMAHRPIKLRKGWEKKYIHSAADFVPPPSKPGASGGAK